MGFVASVLRVPVPGALLAGRQNSERRSRAVSDFALTSFTGNKRWLITQAWGKFLAAHPNDDSIRPPADPPKPDYGNRMKKGASWRGDDGQRFRRGHTPSRLRAATTMVDGSPLRRLTPGLGAVDVDGDPWFCEAAHV